MSAWCDAPAKSNELRRNVFHTRGHGGCDRGGMHRTMRADIDRWRDAGLIVDEDFERGISVRARRWRTAGVAAVTAALSLVTWYVIAPPPAASASRHHVRPLRDAAPARPTTGRRGRLNI